MQTRKLWTKTLGSTRTQCLTKVHSPPLQVQHPISVMFLQVIPVKVISNSGNQIKTCGLIDSGSDITMIDPSNVKLLNVEGAPSKLTLTTVSNADVEEEGMKVNFKIAPVDSQNDHVLNVNSAWAVKDLTIPEKHTKLSRSVEQCPLLHQVSFFHPTRH